MSKLKKEVEAELARRRAVGPSSAGGGAGALRRDIRLDSGRLAGCQVKAGNAKKEYVSLREFSRRVGVSLMAVQKAVAAGRLTTHDLGGRWPQLDWDEAYEAWCNTRIVQNNNRFGELESDPEGEKDGGSLAAKYTIARTKLTEEQAAKTKLEREELEGHLHRDEDIRKACGNTVTAFRSRMMALPGKLTRLVSGITGYSDLVALETAIQPLVHEALEEMSRLYDPEAIKHERKRRQGK